MRCLKTVLFGILLIITGCSDYNLHRINQNNDPPIPDDTGLPPITYVDPEPDIVVDPEYIEFGDITAGCEEIREITISNVGTDTLIVDRIVYSATEGLNFDLMEAENGTIPFSLEPGEEAVTEVIFLPMAEDYDLGYLTVDSNDPDEPTVLVSQDGEGVRDDSVIDEYEQEETIRADIMFVIDNSGSMNDDQANLSANISDFISALDSTGADYQIGVITTDSASFVGDVVTFHDADRVTELANQVSMGTYGSAYEKGLQYAEEATSSGGDATAASGFIRDDSIFSIVFVSDEDDFSTGSVSDYVTHFESLKSNPDESMVHAIVGDDPGGCGSASAGTRYVDTADQTGGLFFSICDTDWGANLQALAIGATTNRLTFYLSKDPIIDTIQVYVEGIEETSTWTYDSAINAIIFHTALAPEAGELIDITYGTYGEC